MRRARRGAAAATRVPRVVGQADRDEREAGAAGGGPGRRPDPAREGAARRDAPGVAGEPPAAGTRGPPWVARRSRRRRALSAAWRMPRPRRSRPSKARMGLAPVAPSTGAGTKLDPVQAKALADGTVSRARGGRARRGGGGGREGGRGRRRSRRPRPPPRGRRHEHGREGPRSRGAGPCAPRPAPGRWCGREARARRARGGPRVPRDLRGEAEAGPRTPADAREPRDLPDARRRSAPAAGIRPDVRRPGQQAFGGDRRRAATLVAEHPAAVAEHARLAKAYAAFVRQQTEAGPACGGRGAVLRRSG